MSNYYKELELDPKDTTDVLRKKVQSIHSMAIRRLNSTLGDAEREYNARKTLEKIEHALDIFQNDENRKAYDESLGGSEKSRGNLTAEKPTTPDAVEKNISSSEAPSNTQEDPSPPPITDEEAEDNRKLQDIMLKKAIKEALEEQQASQKDVSEPSKQNTQRAKAHNFVIRAKQSLDAILAEQKWQSSYWDKSRLEQVKEFTEAALNEDATYPVAWEVFFYYHVILKNSNCFTYDLSLLNPSDISMAMTNCRRSANYENIEKLPDFDEYQHLLRQLEELENVKISSLRSNATLLQKLSNQKDDLKAWLGSEKRFQPIARIVEDYRQEAQAKAPDHYIRAASLPNEVWEAYKKIQEYSSASEQEEIHQRILNFLEKVWQSDLDYAYKNYCACLENDILSPLKQLQNRLDLVDKKFHSAKVQSEMMNAPTRFILGMGLLFISFFFHGVKLNHYDSWLSDNVIVLLYDYWVFKDVRVFGIINLWRRRIMNLIPIDTLGFVFYDLLILVIIYLIYKVTVTLKASTAYVQWGLMFITLPLSAIGALRFGSSIGWLPAILLILLYGYLLFDWILLVGMAEYTSETDKTGKAVTPIDKLFGFKR